MLVSCQECGHENQLGAIFCRSCGAKLDIEHIAPKVEGSGNAFGIIKMIYRFIMVLVLLGLIGIIVALFIPWGHTAFESLPEEEQTKITEKCKLMMEKAEKGRGPENKFDFSPAEASFAYINTFLEKVEEEGASAYNVENVNFSLDDDLKIFVALDTKLGGKVPVRFELMGELVDPEEAAEEEVEEDMDEESFDEEDGEKKETKKEEKEEPKNVVFKVLQCKMGHVPLPAFLNEKIIDKFMPLIEDKNVEKLLKAIKKLEVTNDEEDPKFKLILKSRR